VSSSRSIESSSRVRALFKRGESNKDVKGRKFCLREE
jgi:hypothetical protein